MFMRCMIAMLTFQLCAVAWSDDLLRETTVRKAPDGHEIAFRLSPSGEKLKFDDSDALIVAPDRDIKGLHVVAKRFFLRAFVKSVELDPDKHTGRAELFSLPRIEALPPDSDNASNPLL